MIFNSIHYAAFFALILLAVWALRNRVAPRNCLLLAASYYFYGYWDWRFLGLLWFTTILDYTCARLIVRPSADAAPSRRDRAVLAVSIVSNLALLGFFKYFNFFAGSTQALLQRFGLHADVVTLNIVLPVGISFYTFQSMSYVVDVYRGQMRAEKSLLNFALYVTYFPQLVAGPIERADRLIPQLARPTHFTWRAIYSGTYLIASGLFKKVVIADNVAKAVDAAFSQANPSAAMALLGMYAFAIQIYCDFSAYTDIARGSARMMGVELMQNFDLPYFATNPSDFWRRWHISLSTWLRDYLYIPLGGNRKGALRTYLNLLITMTLGGLWHGANWTFIIWGVYHGVLLCLHRAASPLLKRYANPQGRVWPGIWRAVCALMMFHLWAISMVLFRARNLTQAMVMFKAMLSGAMGFATAEHFFLAIVLACAIVLLIAQLLQAVTRDRYVIFRIPWPVRAVIYAGAVLGFFAFGEFYGEAFIYFQF